MHKFVWCKQLFRINAAFSNNWMCLCSRVFRNNAAMLRLSAIYLTVLNSVWRHKFYSSVFLNNPNNNFNAWKSVDYIFLPSITLRTYYTPKNTRLWNHFTVLEMFSCSPFQYVLLHSVQLLVLIKGWQRWGLILPMKQWTKMPWGCVRFCIVLWIQVFLVKRPEPKVVITVHAFGASDS